MSEVVPVTTRVVNDDGAVSEWERRYEAIQKILFNGTEKVLGSMGDFQKELVKHLDEMTELNGEIAKRNAALAMKLSNFERDICHIRDYYKRIIATTKTLVDYGCDQGIIPHIRELIEEKRYSEAKTEVNGFFVHLTKAIKRVEKAIDKMHEDCPNMDTVKDKLMQSVTAGDPLTTKQVELQESHGRVFRLGTSTLVYMIAGATAGIVVASCLPQEAAKLTEVVTSAGSEVFTFCTGNVLTGLRSIMEQANLTHQLKKRAESNIIDVCRCLTGFFDQLTHFQSNIKTIEVTIDNLKDDMADLQEEVDGDINAHTVYQWKYVIKITQSMFESFTCLNTVIEKPTEGFSEEDFQAVMKRLTRSIELTSLGTPV